jgi:AAA family ATP:ADP antiporter
MTETTNRLLRLHPGEAGLVVSLGLLLLVNSLSIQISNIVSVSGFIESTGVNQLLFVWIIDMGLIVAATAAQSLMIDRFNRTRLLGWMCFAFAAAYIVIRLLFVFHAPDWLNYSLLYFLTDQQWLFFPVLFWVLANDIYDPAQAKRLFPLVSSFSFAGKLLGIIFAIISPRLLAWLGAASAEVLLFNVCLYLVAYVVVQARLQSIRIRAAAAVSRESIGASLSEGWGFVKDVLSFRYLVMALLALAICDTIIEFRFLVVTDSAAGPNFQVFYGSYKLVTTVIAIALQSLATGRLIERLNLKNTFFVLPVVALIGMITLLATSAAAGAVLAYAALKLADGTLNDSARKSFQALVPEERRGRVSMFMDSYLLAVGTIVGSVLMALIVFGSQVARFSSPQLLYLGIGIAAASMALLAIIFMRRAYDNSLLNWRLRRRQRGASTLDKLTF